MKKVAGFFRVLGCYLMWPLNWAAWFIISEAQDAAIREHRKSKENKD